MVVLCKGHRGILCGACAGGYGKVRRGDCIQCGDRLKQVTFSCILALVYGGLVAFMAMQAMSVPAKGASSQEQEPATREADIKAGGNALGESSSLLEGQDSSELAQSLDVHAHPIAQLPAQSAATEVTSTTKARSFTSDVLKVRCGLQVRATKCVLKCFVCVTIASHVRKMTMRLSSASVPCLCRKPIGH